MLFGRRHRIALLIAAGSSLAVAMAAPAASAVRKTTDSLDASGADGAFKRLSSRLALAQPHSAAINRAMAAETAPDAAADADGSGSEIIVTGTRERAKRAVDSVSPIDVVSTETITRTGQTNLTDALVRLSPSASKPAFGHATTTPTNFISLRGLNPSQTLVLLNGKRRHGVSTVYTSGSMDGSTPVDIDLIPAALIGHVEVLRDGAGAQYGSDAIAGVVNILFKSSADGGTYRAEYGQHYAGDGTTVTLAAQQAFSLGDSGFLSVSGDYRYHGFTDRSDIDDRTNAHTTPLFGDPKSNKYTVGYNAGYQLGGGLELYSFGTYAYRDVDQRQLYRLPSSIPAVHPHGYVPRYVSYMDSYAATVGLRGDDLAGWNWDLSSVYGVDLINRHLKDSANLNLYAATGSTPIDFYLGKYKFTQWTNTLDFSRPFDTGVLPFPVNVAVGGEFRRETYHIGAGELASYQYGGGQASVGISPVSEGDFSRGILSGYIDIATRIMTGWQVGFAGRYEHYSDFGDTVSGKFSTRIDIVDEFALRGTVSNGTRAPSLANQYYNQIGNTPTTYSGTLAANSPAAGILGSSFLEPEKATNVTIGAVLKPADRFDVTVDVYQIDISNRISSSPAIRGQLAIDAFALAGLIVDPGIPINNVSVRYFANAADTRNRGVDVNANYRLGLGDAGTIDWKLAFNYNTVDIRHIRNNVLGVPLVNVQTESWMTTAAPENRATLSALWRQGPWNVFLEGQRYGKTLTALSYRAGPNANSTTVFEMHVNEPRTIVNLDVTYQANDVLSLSVGANNLFDVYPSLIPMDNRYYGTERYNGFASQISINGGYYYARAVLNF